MMCLNSSTSKKVVTCRDKGIHCWQVANFPGSVLKSTWMPFVAAHCQNHGLGFGS